MNPFAHNPQTVDPLPSQPSNLSPDACAIVDAVVEALDLPSAATLGHEETRQEILNERVRHLVVCMQSLADPRVQERLTAPTDLAWYLRYLRERLAEHPATGYVTTAQAQQRIKQGATWSEAVGWTEED